MKSTAITMTVLSALVEPGGNGLDRLPSRHDVEVTSFDVGTPGAENSDFYIEISG